jgi:hypothetical protein
MKVEDKPLTMPPAEKTEEVWQPENDFRTGILTVSSLPRPAERGRQEIARSRSGGCLSLSDVFLVGRNPVGCDRRLRLVEGQRALKDQIMQPILEPVFGTSIPGVRVEAFGPKVADVIRSAETEADQMIDLVRARSMMLDAIFA